MTAPAGIWPILYAFFDADGRPLRAPIAAQVEACVRHGAHGVAVLGLATETFKLSTVERRQILAWTAEALRGRLPLAVTVAESSVEGQIEFVRAAKDAGASWCILQPPPVAGLPEAEYLKFFGAVAAAAELPLAIQNAAQYLGVALSNPGLKRLRHDHPNVSILKAEAPALQIRQLIEDTEGAFAVLNGRGGLELPDNLRAGCTGMIPAPESFDVQVRIYEAMKRGDEAEADRLYREILPLIVFLMSSIENFLCYGKRVVAKRLGLGEVHARSPSQRPTPFGLALVERYAAALGAL